MFSSREGASEEIHLGLGLYMVRMVAEAHGGHVQMQELSGVVSVSMAMPINAHEMAQIPSN